MKALDLRAEISHQIKRMPNDSFSLSLLLNYVKQLIDAEDGDSTLTGNKLRLWNRTMVLSKLYKGWDGADAVPIENKTITNMQNILKKGSENMFSGWVLFPDDNGTLLLQSKNRQASVSLGNKYYSYVFKKNDNIISGENIRFSISSFLNVIQLINNNVAK